MDWDAFAQRCGASFRCSHRGGRAWQFEAHWCHRLHRLDLCRHTLAGEEKVGQCGVGVGRRHAVFADAIQLLPEHAGLWPAAMAAVLDHLGPGAYAYGSPWNPEEPREAALAGLAGVTIDGVEATTLDVVEFSRWPSFDAYVRAVSENVRRNARKATASHPGLTIVVAGGGRGCRVVRRAWQSFALRRALFRRKGVRRSTASLLVRSAARWWSVAPYTRVAYAVAGGDVLAYHLGIAFGPDWAYLEGAAGADATGVAWHLMLRVIEQAWARSEGRGRFIMGSDDGTQVGQAAWEGLRRSRRQCCAMPLPTSIVRFRYDRPTQ